MTAGPPVLFAFGLHLHQPVGNFDWVFEQHLAQVYRPLLHEIIGGGAAPSSLHLSGPLLDWLERHHGGFLDELGRWAADGRIELLAAGYDEPILVTLTREDRLEQIGRMRDALQARFGVQASGLWLTERVWEPHLVADLHEAGIRYALVDDRHFLVAGFEREVIHRPWRTEDGGRTLDLFPIDERLRYLVPFRPPAEFADYLTGLGTTAPDQPPSPFPRVAVLADDGEKFGGWPGTFEWVYQKGWLKEFLAALDRLRESGAIRLVTFSEALREVPPAGIAYLPSASYHEMEGWALPTPAARRLIKLEAELGEARMKGPEGALLRGSHWRNFFAKYSEANRMHKKMLALSRLCRDRGEPPLARRAIGKAQCNDAYWHGVFGGLYLPHLRNALWHELARAEADLRRGEPLGWESDDFDCDGQEEILVRSGQVSVVISPARGAGIEELSDLSALRNHADTLTRRREPYHEPMAHLGTPEEGEAISIHNIHRGLESLPPVDPEPRAIFQERIHAAGVDAGALAAGSAQPIHSWASAMAGVSQRANGDTLVFQLEMDRLTKTIRIHSDGRIELTLAWQPDESWPADAWFTTELSLGHPLRIDAPRATEWRYPIETVSQSESGLDRTPQGESITLAWPVRAGVARVSLTFPA